MKLIVAMDENNAIGYNGQLLCHLPNDLNRFKRITKGNPIIMGRKTFESLPNGPLEDRINIVLSSKPKFKPDNCLIFRRLSDVIHTYHAEHAIIIGGEKVYEEALNRNLVDTMYITKIHHKFENADTYFPKPYLLDDSFGNWVKVIERFHKADENNPYDYMFNTYIKYNADWY